MLAEVTVSGEHGGSSTARQPDVAHLLMEAARKANMELARDAETDASMLEVQAAHMLPCLLHTAHG